MSFTGLDRYRIMLDGVDDYVNFVDIDGIDGASALTVSVWVNIHNLWGSVDNFIFSKRLDDNNNIQMYITTAGLLVFDVSNGGLKGGWTYISSGAENVWYNFVMVFNGSFTDGDSATQNAGRLKAYYNAVSLELSFTGDIATTIADCGANPVQIGQESPSSDNMYGIISQVAIWNTALTSEEVTTLNSGGRHSDWSTMQKSNQLANWRLKTSDMGSGKHLDFDGGDEYLLIADGIPDSTDSFSVAAWFSCDVLDEESDIFSMQASSGNEPFRMYTKTDNKLGFQLTPASDTRVYPETTSSEVVIVEWIHYVGTFSEGKFNQYLNGSLAAVEQDYSGTFTDVKAGWTTATIGSKNNTPDNEFNGKIGQVSIWNTVLAPHQVAKMYLEGRHSNLQTNFSTGMAGYWRMGSASDDNVPTVVADQVGSNNAIPANMASSNEQYSLSFQDSHIEYDDIGEAHFTTDDPDSIYGLGISEWVVDGKFEDSILKPNGMPFFSATLSDPGVAIHNTINPLTGLGDCKITIGSAGTGCSYIPLTVHAVRQNFFFKLSFNYRVVSGEMRVSAGSGTLFVPTNDYALFSDRTETTKTQFIEYFQYTGPGGTLNINFFDGGNSSVYHIDDISLIPIWPLNHGDGVNIEETDIQLDAIPVDETETQPDSGWQSTIFGYYKSNNDEIRSTDAPT